MSNLLGTKIHVSHGPLGGLTGTGAIPARSPVAELPDDDTTDLEVITMDDESGPTQSSRATQPRGPGFSPEKSANLNVRKRSREMRDSVWSDLMELSKKKLAIDERANELRHLELEAQVKAFAAQVKAYEEAADARIVELRQMAQRILMMAQKMELMMAQLNQRDPAE